ncbi:MAG: vWA domain-containing protein, partial [Planctomycetota bacterium]
MHRVARHFHPANALLIVGAALLLVAAAGWTWPSSRTPTVAVVVDQSASTRGASWREALPDFDGVDTVVVTTRGQPIKQPVGVDAVVALTDGRLRFDHPPTVPTWVLLDPSLDKPSDSQAIELAPHFAGVLERETRSSRIVAGDGDGDAVTLDTNADDLWPENDRLTLPTAIANAPRPFWIGPDAPPGFETNPATLGTQPLVVLHNDTPDLATQERLASYVSNLGGTLVITGGPDAFAFGPRDPLGKLSPLLSRAPVEPSRVTLLIDHSGSMTGDRATHARRAAIAALAVLPPDTRIDVATFARDVTWLARGVPAANVLRDDFPPAPTGGETNIDAALREVLATVTGDSRVLLLTDGEATPLLPDTTATIDLLLVGNSNI